MFMDYKEAYEQIKVIEIEVRNYADEGYKVKYDFDNNIIQWRDYYMWNNNFTKCITDSKKKILDERLHKSKLIESLDSFINGTVKDKDILERSGKWEIKIEFNDGTKMRHKDEDRFPAAWIEWRTMIESTTECTFRLH